MLKLFISLKNVIKFTTHTGFSIIPHTTFDKLSHITGFGFRKNMVLSVYYISTVLHAVTNDPLYITSIIKHGLLTWLLVS
jgi:hypothetical protein